jgi:hypothetical protein
MIRSKSIEHQLRNGRLDAKTRDSLFRGRIEHGANVARFVSKAILQTVKDVFPIDHEVRHNQLDLGRIRLPSKSTVTCCLPIFQNVSCA